MYIFLKQIACNIEKLLKLIDKVCIFFICLLVIIMFFNTIMRYVFSFSNIGLQELEWYFFSIVFLFGIATAINNSSHISIDILSEKFSKRANLLICLLGNVVFLWPILFVVFYYGVMFAYSSYEINEISPDPGGLSHRFIIKSMISISLIFIFLASLKTVINNFLDLKGKL